MFTLDLDCGNSFIKWAIVKDGEFLSDSQISEEQSLMEDIANALAQESIDLDRIRASAVWSEERKQKFAKRFFDAYSLDVEYATTTAFANGVHCAYRDPGRMGVDRWCALQGALKLDLQAIASSECGARPMMIVDSGTALTIDFVEGDKHLGGFIVPGIRTQIDALLQNTDSVRLQQEVQLESIDIGINTEQAVLNGVLAQMASFIDTQYQRFSTQYRSDGKAVEQSPVGLYLTGGGAEYHLPHLSSPCRYEQDLVLLGLNVLLP